MNVNNIEAIKNNQFSIRVLILCALASPLLMHGLNAEPTLQENSIVNQVTTIGTVFFDSNLNGYLDDGEAGIPAVRIATVTGLIIETDGYGRFHIPDGNIQNISLGQNQLLKVDVRSLPQGAKMTSENPRLLRNTSTLNKVNFGIVF